MQELFDRAGDSHETKLFSDAVINLYAAHVHSLLYPFNHPLISDSLKNAFQGLRKFLRKKPHVRLETSEGRLMVDGEVLDGDILVLEHFASWLNSRNIKALSFARDLTQRELISFHKIISTKKLTVDEISKAMAEKSIVNISVHPMEFSATHAKVASPDDTAHQGLIKDYESTMFHMESGKAQSPFFTRPARAGPHEDAANYGLINGYESKMYQQESPKGLSPFSTDSDGEKGSVQEMAEGTRHAECVEALLEYDISKDNHSVIRGIPPLEMAHLLNTMLFRDPGGEVVDRVIRAYFDGAEEMRGEDAVDRCRIFLTGLKSDLRPSFLSRCASLFSTDNLLANQEPGILPEAVQGTYKPSGTEADAVMPPEQRAFVPCRTIEGSDFSFDFVACGNAVLHDIEIPGETTSLFNEAHIAHFQDKGALDALSSSLRAAAVDAGHAAIIAECTEEAITEASFDVVIEILESNSLDNDAYRKLEGRLSALVELFLEKGEFEKVLELFNSLKTQSLQGKWRDHAAAMIRKIFSSDKVNAKVVDAVRQYGRKRRDSAFRLTIALRSFIAPYLLDALSEESDTSTRRFIMSLLTSIRSDAVKYIAKRLGDSSWHVLRNMLYLLRECRERSCAPAVRDFLEHEVPLVRLEALRTLLSFQDPEADAYVIKFLRSDVFQLQKGAVRLAGAYRIKYAVSHLVRLLLEKDISGKRSLFKKGIVRALGRIGDGRAVVHLLNICRSTSELHKDEFDKLKIEIFKTLYNYPAATIRPLIDYGMHSTNEEIMAISKKLMKRYGLSAVKQR